MTALNAPHDPALVDRLRVLYHDASKHSVYQSVPAFVAKALGYCEEIHSLWRSDAPRYDYIAQRLNLPAGSIVADIGANTGFFSLNLAHGRPDWRVRAIEMNPRHAEFIRLAAEAFDMHNVQVSAVSCDYAGLEHLPFADATLLLNVVHHAGFDFDRQLADDNRAYSEYVLAYLSRLRSHTGKLVFQIGSNRGGDKTRPVHPRDDHCARLSWTIRVLRDAGWAVDHLGYAQLSGNGEVVFADAAPELLAFACDGIGDDDQIRARLAELDLARFPGEFHLRPIFIASSGRA